VDCWPLATVCTNQSGVSLGRYPPTGVTGRSVSSSLGSHVTVRKGFAAGAPPRRKVPRETQWGQLDGPGPLPQPRRREGPPGPGRPPRSCPLLELLCPSGRAAASRAAAPPCARPEHNSDGLTVGRPQYGGLTIVTWLILPVVICLSQRLSHACLSISNYTVKLRMAH
jgi:hypothetical protein